MEDGSRDDELGDGSMYSRKVTENAGTEWDELSRQVCPNTRVQVRGSQGASEREGQEGYLPRLCFDRRAVCQSPVFIQLSLGFSQGSRVKVDKDSFRTL